MVVGRSFSTVYRLILVTLAISGATLSILSATSCSFVNYDHHYNKAGAEAVASQDDDDRRLAETPTTSPVAAVVTATPPTTSPVAAVVTANPPTTSPVAAVVTTTPPTKSPIKDDEGVTASTPPTKSPIKDDEGVAASTPPTKSPVAGVSDTLTPTKSPVASAVTTPAAPTTPFPTSRPTPYTPPDSLRPPRPTASLPSSTSAVDNEAAVKVQGSAGLFCDTKPTIERIKSIFTTANSLKNFEKMIEKTSEDDISEEIARNGVIVASIFGLIVAFILTMSFLIERKLCLEKYILGLVFMISCTAQGTTFVFFNSDEHCDGDIVNEIINYDPCTIGKGSSMSIAALIIYFIGMVMVCRAPSAPWITPLRCFRKTPSSEDNGLGGDERGSRVRLSELELADDDSVGGGVAGGSDNNNSGMQSEAPEWMGDKEKQENEII